MNLIKPKHIESSPFVYDKIQMVLGNQILFKHLKKFISGLNPESVLDIGGGTGFYRKLFKPDCQYTCLDIDKDKIQRFTNKYPNDKAIIANAIDTPIYNSSFDLVLCIAVSHHLQELEFEKLLSESKRILKPNGVFIFLDAIKTDRLISNLLWQYDCGDYPHSKEYLTNTITRYYHIVNSQELSIWHKYIILGCVK